MLREELNALGIAISAEDMLIQGIAAVLFAKHESAVLTFVAVDVERAIQGHDSHSFPFSLWHNGLLAYATPGRPNF